jgi:hypothetical protein
VRSAAEHLPSGWRLEHVVVDDASSDESPELLERWSSHVTLELRPQNEGQSSTLNRCLSLARGEWVCWLNADDFLLPWALHDACPAFGHGDVVYGDAVILDGTARFSRLLPEHPFSLWTLRFWGPYLPVGSVFLRRSLLSQLGWREDLSLLLDWDLWLRAAESGASFRYVPTPYAAIRWHDAQESAQARPDRLDEKIRVRKAHGLPAEPRAWRAWQRVASIDHGLRKAACGSYTKQFRTRVLRGRSMRWFDGPEGGTAASLLYARGYGRRWDVR